jgi:hypothetical protein
MTRRMLAKQTSCALLRANINCPQQRKSAVRAQGAGKHQHLPWLTLVKPCCSLWPCVLLVCRHGRHGTPFAPCLPAEGRHARPFSAWSPRRRPPPEGASPPQTRGREAGGGAGAAARPQPPPLAIAAALVALRWQLSRPGAPPKGGGSGGGGGAALNPLCRGWCRLPVRRGGGGAPTAAVRHRHGWFRRHALPRLCPARDWHKGVRTKSP